jgi:hypothetical protein
VLHTQWVLYYHNPEDSDWSKGSYTCVMTLTSLEEFWAMHSALLPSKCLQGGMFFLMKKGIQPIWEDPQNKNGGCWSYKVSLSSVHDAWRELSLRLVIEQLCSVPDLINGISISPKKGFCVIKIWNKNHTRSSTDVLYDSLSNLHHTDAMFIPFKHKN